MVANNGRDAQFIYTKEAKMLQTLTVAHVSENIVKIHRRDEVRPGNRRVICPLLFHVVLESRGEKGNVDFLRRPSLDEILHGVVPKAQASTRLRAVRLFLRSLPTSCHGCR